MLSSSALLTWRFTWTLSLCFPMAQLKHIFFLNGIYFRSPHWLFSCKLMLFEWRNHSEHTLPPLKDMTLFAADYLVPGDLDPWDSFLSTSALLLKTGWTSTFLELDLFSPNLRECLEPCVASWKKVEKCLKFDLFLSCCGMLLVFTLINPTTCVCTWNMR